MTFKEVLHEIVTWIRKDGRVSYRAIQRQFDEVDEEYLEDLKDAILYAHPVIIEDRGFRWNDTVSSESQSDQASGPISAAKSGRTAEAERRRLTVMFCDLENSTGLAQRLDPEDLREVIRAYQAAATNVVSRYQGHTAQYLGDGLLVYFGWPQAHENDAERAVLTGLEIIDKIQSQLNSELTARYNVQLGVRIGVHSGLVVVGQMGGEGRYESLATGETVNIAARLEGLADSNSIVISDATHKLVSNAFEVEDLGLQQLKGVTHSVRVFRVISQQNAVGHSHIEGVKAKPFMVGRDEEIGLLHRRWEQAKNNLGQVVSISGNAGIGKSCLVDSIRAEVYDEGFDCLVIRCSSYHQNSAYFPLIRTLEGILQLESLESDEARLDKLAQYLDTIGLPREGILPYLAKVLSIESNATAEHLKAVTPQKQKQLTSDALVSWLFKLAQRKPILLIWEDLHWADPSTLEVVGFIVDQIPTVGMLAVFTYRPQFVPSWRQHSHITPIVLSRLELVQTEALIAHWADHLPLPPQVVDHIIDKTDGVPLFIEELTKMLLDSGILQKDGQRYQLSGSLEDLSIPETLQDSLMARLDQLVRAKEIAQLGSVIGREFSFQGIEAIFPKDREALEQGLDELISAELLYVRGRIPNSIYTFKHALVQDAAYNTLLKSTRQKVHLSLAHFIETNLKAIEQKQPELIAHHYTEGNAFEKALEYWIKAERFASQNSSYSEAIAHARRGLQIVDKVTDLQMKMNYELDLLLALGPSLIATKGFSFEGVGEVYSRARTLAKEIGDTERTFAVLWGLCSHNITRANHEEARRVGEEMNTIRVEEDTGIFIISKIALAAPCYSLSKFTESFHQFAHGVPTYKNEHHDLHVRLCGMDMGVFCRGFGSHSAWQYGRVETAVEWSNESVRIAKEVAHPFSRAVGQAYAAMLHQYMRDIQATQEFAATTIALSTEQNFAYYLAWGMIIHGWCVGIQGDTQQGLKQINEGLVLFRDSGSGRGLPFYLSLQAEIQKDAGDLELALATIESALIQANRLNERWWESEIMRLRGEYRYALSPDNIEEVIADYQSALEISQSQGANSLGLRAASALARVYAEREQRDKGLTVLQPILDSFVEGLEGQEVIAARELHDSLINP